MLTNFHAVSFDANDVGLLARFWSEATAGELNSDGLPYFAIVRPKHKGVPLIIVMQVPEPKTAKNRVHIEFEVVDLQHEREQLETIGATFVDAHEWDGNRWLVMADPEGNQFCLVESQDE